MQTHRPMSAGFRTPILPCCPSVLVAGLLFAGCSAPADPSPTPTVPLEVVVTSNGQAGGIAGLGLDLIPWEGASRVHGDAVLRLEGNRAYVVNRLGADNLQILDLEGALTTLAQWSLEPGSNLQDVAVVSEDDAYIVQYNRTVVSHLDLQTGVVSPLADLADLAEADPDGLPELSSILRVGETLLVAVQRLARTAEGFIPIGDSYLVKLSMTTGERLGTLKLTFPNPYGLLERSPDGSIWLAEPGRLDVLGDGGVEQIEPEGLTSLGSWATDTRLEGEVLEVRPLAGKDGESLRVALLNIPATDDRSASTRLLRLNEQLEPVDLLLDPSGWQLWDLEVDSRAQIWVTDRDLLAPGLWRLAPGEETFSFIPFGQGLLPPSSLRTR